MAGTRASSDAEPPAGKDSDGRAGRERKLPCPPWRSMGDRTHVHRGARCGRPSEGRAVGTGTSDTQSGLFPMASANLLRYPVPMLRLSLTRALVALFALVAMGRAVGAPPCPHHVSEFAPQGVPSHQHEGSSLPQDDPGGSCTCVGHCQAVSATAWIEPSAPGATVVFLTAVATASPSRPRSAPKWLLPFIRPPPALRWT